MSTNNFYKTQEELNQIDSCEAANAQLRFHALHTDCPQNLSTAETIVMYTHIEVDLDGLPMMENFDVEFFDSDVENLRQLMNELGDLNDDSQLEYLAKTYSLDPVKLRDVFEYYLERNS